MPRELERLLLHPMVLLALGLWALNDHVLKAAWGNPFTGKISDVTSLIVSPILLATLSACLGLCPRSPRALLILWSIAMAGVMVAIKLFGPAADLYRYGLAVLQWPFRCLLTLSLRPLVPVFLAMDPSDLWTLPAACVPVLLAYAPPRAGGHMQADPTPSTESRSFGSVQCLTSLPSVVATEYSEHPWTQ